MKYRLCPEANSTQQASDGVTVVKYLWDNAKTFGIDKRKIAMFGYEGGAHVAMSVCGMLAGTKQASLLKLVYLSSAVDTGFYSD